MTFKFQATSTKNADGELFGWIENILSKMPNQSVNAAKIAVSDQHTGDARALLILCDSKAPDGKGLTTPWTYKEFTTGSDYDTMYAECVDFLNNGPLGENQKYYSKITMSNAEDNKATLVLWWQTQN